MAAMIMRRPIARSISGAAAGSGLALGAALLMIAILAALTSSSSGTATVTNYMIMVVAVMALAIFSGNSGILSFGHVAFMALGAQISATLTLPAMVKTSLIPNLPQAIAQAQSGFPPTLLRT